MINVLKSNAPLVKIDFMTPEESVIKNKSFEMFIPLSSTRGYRLFIKRTNTFMVRNKELYSPVSLHTKRYQDIYQNEVIRHAPWFSTSKIKVFNPNQNVNTRSFGF